MCQFKTSSSRCTHFQLFLRYGLLWTFTYNQLRQRLILLWESLRSGKDDSRTYLSCLHLSTRYRLTHHEIMNNYTGTLPYVSNRRFSLERILLSSSEKKVLREEQALMIFTNSSDRNNHECAKNLLIYLHFLLLHIIHLIFKKWNYIV